MTTNLIDEYLSYFEAALEAHGLLPKSLTTEEETEEQTLQ